MHRAKQLELHCLANNLSLFFKVKTPLNAACTTTAFHSWKILFRSLSESMRDLTKLLLPRSKFQQQQLFIGYTPEQKE
jgi:hypothetical protein